MSDVITNLPPKVRFSLRGPAALDGAGDFSLSTRIGEIAVTGAGVALCLGPDEWILEADDGAEAIAAAFAGSETPHSLVEISDRALSLKLTGPEALALLEMGLYQLVRAAHYREVVLNQLVSHADVPLHLPRFKQHGVGTQELLRSVLGLVTERFGLG